MSDLVEKYCKRTELLLRMLDPEDYGHLVPFEVRAEIQRVLHMTQPCCTVLAPDCDENDTNAGT
jgi:hypothetical protein